MNHNQQILLLSGKKGSGKTTASNFILGLYLTALNIVHGNFKLNEKGELWVTDIFGDLDGEGVFDINRGTPEMLTFLNDHLDSYFKIYGFADLLKQEICMKILGLTYAQCYGMNEQKDTLTNLKWEDMPGIISDKLLWEDLDTIVENREKYWMWHERGYMSAREVMQYVGSNIFRKMYNDVWVDSTLRRIQDEASTTAIINDGRFPNEILKSQATGGKVIRLTRSPYLEDKAISETALDKDKFDWSLFDCIIQNDNMNIDQQNTAIYMQLKEWNLLPIELEGMEVQMKNFVKEKNIIRLK
jgi:hypothetical protein